MNNNYLIPFYVVRDHVHLGYDYLRGEPTQWDYLSEIPCNDLEELEKHATLEVHYEHEFDDGPGDWAEVLRLIRLEINYRSKHS